MEEFDVFLSHNSKDKALVEQIAERLADEEGLDVFLDIWNLIPGDPWQESLEDALNNSHAVAVFLGPSGISAWHNEEMRVALNARAASKQRRVIPVLLPGARQPDIDELPPFLARLSWVDFRKGVDDEDAFSRLVKGIWGEKPGRRTKKAAPKSMQAEKMPLPASGKAITSIIPPALLDALQKESLVLFIGADLPQSITGLPSRNDLALGLAQQYGLDESLSISEVAMRVSSAGNRFEFTDYIRRALGMVGKPGVFFEALSDFCIRHEIKTVISTAYDDHFERAYQQLGRRCNKIIQANNLPFIDEDLLTLIKLYGDIQQLTSLIVLERDHHHLLRNQEYQPILDYLRNILRTKTILFIGYDFSDPDFRFLFDQIAESHFARMAFSITEGMSDTDKAVWKDRGIVVFEADPVDFLRI